MNNYLIRSSSNNIDNVSAFLIANRAILFACFSDNQFEDLPRYFLI